MPDQQPEGDQLPEEIANSETIVRAILTPWHYNNGKLKKQAFKPPVGKREISAIRQVMGDDFCKDKGVEIGSKNQKNNYRGLLALTAAAIRHCGSQVTDSREEFLGHADVDHGFPTLNPDDPAATPDDLKRMDDRIDALLAVSKFEVDPSPSTAGWNGPPLKIDEK